MNIRATCPDCGDVVLPREDMQVRICAEDRSGSYCFRCPSCGVSVAKPAEDRIVLIEETSEILIDKPNLVRFEARRADGGHVDAVTPGDVDALVLVEVVVALVVSVV